MLSLAAQCIVIGPVCDGRAGIVMCGRTGTRCPNSQHAHSVCVSLSAFFIVVVVAAVAVVDMMMPRVVYVGARR